jgi:hypothetical protein
VCSQLVRCQCLRVHMQWHLLPGVLLAVCRFLCSVTVSMCSLNVQSGTEAGSEDSTCRACPVTIPYQCFSAMSHSWQPFIDSGSLAWHVSLIRWCLFDDPHELGDLNTIVSVTY